MNRKFKKTAGVLALAATAAIAAEFGFQVNLYSWQDPGFGFANYMFQNYWQSYNRQSYVPQADMTPGDRVRIKYYDKVVEFRLSASDVYCAPRDATAIPFCVWLGPRPLEQPMEVLSSQPGGYDSNLYGAVSYVQTGYWAQETVIVNGYVTITAFFVDTGIQAVQMSSAGFNDGFRRMQIY